MTARLFRLFWRPFEKTAQFMTHGKGADPRPRKKAMGLVPSLNRVKTQSPTRQSKRRWASDRMDSAMAKKHKWTFAARFRAGAYGWRGSALASKRLKEAVTEIRKVARTDPVLATDGVVHLMERLWPALEKIDTSSGALGSAVNRTIDELLPVLIEAPADLPTRNKWTDRLYEAVMDDGVDYLAQVEAAWGDICAFPELANRWVEALLAPLRDCWSKEGQGFVWFKGAAICLSSLVKAGRHVELEELLSLQQRRSWYFEKFGAEALVRQGRVDEAVARAEACLSESPNTSWGVSPFCERVLLQAGRRDEAYRRYGRASAGHATYLGTYRAIIRKYPERDPRQVLLDLAGTAERGKWFAAAKEAGFLDLALKFAAEAANPGTLARAARDFVKSNPEWAARVAVLALREFVTGVGYEPERDATIMAFNALTSASTAMGKTNWARSEIDKLLELSPSEVGCSNQATLRVCLESRPPSEICS